MAAASNNELTTLTNSLTKTQNKINYFLSLGDRITIKQQDQLQKLDEHLVVLNEKILKLTMRTRSYSKSRSRSKSRSPNLRGGRTQSKNKNKTRKTRKNN